MAEYDGDEEGSFWPWVTGIVLLAMVIWVAAVLSETEAEPEDAPIVAVSQARRQAATPAIIPDTLVPPARFRVWVRDSSTVMERSSVETYARAGLLRLVSAMRVVMSGVDEPVLEQRVAALRDEIVGDSTAVAGVESLQTAMIQAGSVLAELHRLTGLQDSEEQNLTGARAAAAELEPGVPLDAQRHRVYSYFDFMAESMSMLGTAADSARART